MNKLAKASDPDERADRRKLLELLFIDHPSLREAFYSNASEYAWFKQYLHGRCTQEEALVGAIVHLVEDNKKQFDQIVEYSQRFGTITMPGKEYPYGQPS